MAVATAVADKEAALAQLGRVVSAEQVVTNPLELLTYEVDAALDSAVPDAVVLPQTADEVVRLAQWMRQNRIPLVARGAGTGLSGGAVAEFGGVILSFARMNRVLELDEVGRSVRVEPGVVNQRLDDTLKPRGLYYPPDPASGRTSTLGGNIAENAGGPHCFKYGVCSNYLNALEVVLADGRKVRVGGRALDYPEIDLLAVLCGGEGTLGIMTEANCRIVRSIPAVQTLMAAFDSLESAGRAVSAIISAGLVPATLEMMDQKCMQMLEDFCHPGYPCESAAGLIIETDGFPNSVQPQMDEIIKILEQQNVTYVKNAKNAAERDNIWYGRKSAAGAMARISPKVLMLDGSVPRSRLAETLGEIKQMCAAEDMPVLFVFHAGDGNIHPDILFDPADESQVRRTHFLGRKIMELLASKNGSITGEHGVGCEKRSYMPLMFNLDELWNLQDLKDTFDPDHLLNPGKIIPGNLEPRPVVPAATVAAPTAGVVAPSSFEDAVEVVRAMAQETPKRTLRIQGAGTKSGHMPAADVTLSTANMCGIKTLSIDDLCVTVAAGTPLAQLQEQLAEHKLFTPLVSPWSTSTVGGIVAAGANAPQRMRFGAVRDNVLAMTVVMPDGRVIRAGRPVVKNVAGYDMPKLFTGSWGSFCLIGDVTLKIMPLPRLASSLVIPMKDLAQAMRVGTRLLRTCLTASAVMVASPATGALNGNNSYALIYTAEGHERDVATELDEVRDVLKAERLSGNEMTGFSGNALWSNWMRSATATQTVVRMGVAPKDIAGVVTGLSGLLQDVAFIADVANGHLYAATGEVAALRTAGIGKGGYAVVVNTPLKSLDKWGYTPEGLGVMQGLKKRWDPEGVFNPGAFVV